MTNILGMDSKLLFNTITYLFLGDIVMKKETYNEIYISPNAK